MIRDFAIAATTLDIAAGDAASARRLGEAIALLEPIARQSTDRNLLDAMVRGLLAANRPDDARSAYERLISMGYREPSLLALWRQSTQPRRQARLQ